MVKGAAKGGEGGHNIDGRCSNKTSDFSKGGVFDRDETFTERAPGSAQSSGDTAVEFGVLAGAPFDDRLLAEEVEGGIGSKQVRHYVVFVSALSQEQSLQCNTHTSQSHA